MMRFWLVGTMTILLLTGAAPAREGIVRTTDGQTYRGEVREEDDSVIVVIRGVETVLQRSNVETITYPEGAEQQFNQRLEQLEPNDVRGRLQLAQWAFDRREYDLALRATELALEIDPNSREAVDMQTLIRSQMRMERQQRRQQEQRQQAQDQPQQDQGTDLPPATQRRGVAIERRLLTADDINRLKQKELQRSDTRTRIRFENNVQRRYVETAKLNYQNFTSRPSVEQALEIINYRDDAQGRLARDVRIVDDPGSLREYKTQIQPAILANCATSNCHGAPAGGSFVLYTPADSDAVSYTNFYILQSYTREPPSDTGGVFGAGQRRMIDRARPDNSLLVQYGLPGDVAQYDHPSVRNMRSMFRNREDPIYRRFINWIGQSLTPMTPEYGIEYDPPGTQHDAPATEPSGDQLQQPDEQMEQPQPEQTAPDSPADTPAPPAPPQD